MHFSLERKSSMMIKDLNTLQMWDMWAENQARAHWQVQSPFAMGELKDMFTLLIAIEPGMLMERHANNSEEMLIVLAGRIEAEVNGETAPVEAGQVIAIPAGAQHSFRNTGTVPARLLAVMPTKLLTVEFADTILPQSLKVFEFGQPAQEERNKQIILEFYRRSHRGDLSVYDEMFAPDFVNHGNAVIPDMVGREAFKQAYVTYETAFPDFYTNIDQIMAQGDYVMVRGLSTGTHLGNFMGLPATGKRVEWTGFALYRFNKDGLICERWQDFDGLKLMGELGITLNLYAPA
jgi:steroid delta-isomerase-like uncharacterized protein